jgi:SRSO17 transposase
MTRYTGHLYDRRQVPHASTYVRGLLSDLERKTIEPIAEQAEHEQPRGLQRFVGEGRFDDAPLVAELQRHVAEEIGSPAGILVADPSCFEKKGDDSVGVQRQWNGRLGKMDNCQKACFLGYVSPEGAALIDRRLYLPESWCIDDEARPQCHVPTSIEFETSPALTLAMIDQATVPYQWVVGDEEFGRPSSFRAALRERRKLYAMEMPSNTHVRPVRRDRRGNAAVGANQRISDLARALKPGCWNLVLVKDGTKGPIYVQAADIDVMTKAEGAFTFEVEERLILIRTLGPKPEYKYVFSNARRSSVCLGEVVRAFLARHVVEELFQRAKGEAGLADYEVRSWVGWHHHITFALLASWFLELERRRFRGNRTGHDGATRRTCHRGAAV